MAAPRKSSKRIPGSSSVNVPRGLVEAGSLPWFPFLSDGIHLKLCKVNRATGEMAFLLRAEPGAGLGTHYYHGVVVAYTIRGQWRHLDEGWIAKPGAVIIEPAGSTHAFETVGNNAVEAFVHLTGAVEFRDAAGRTERIENAETIHGRYLAHCALHGIPAADLT